MDYCVEAYFVDCVNPEHGSNVFLQNVGIRKPEGHDMNRHSRETKNLRDVFWQISLLGPVQAGRQCKGEGTPRKLATATQPQFPRIVISLSWTHVIIWSSANWGDCVAVTSICATPFTNKCSTQADNSSRKLRLRCGCHFPWRALALRAPYLEPQPEGKCWNFNCKKRRKLRSLYKKRNTRIMFISYFIRIF
jgi:hypothetical protein